MRPLAHQTPERMALYASSLQANITSCQWRFILLDQSYAFAKSTVQKTGICQLGILFCLGLIPESDKLFNQKFLPL